MEMKEWHTTETNIYQVLSGRSNSYLVSSKNNLNNDFILVDTGRKGSWKKLVRNIDHILGENKLSCLVLTHSHFDHVENAQKIKEKYGAKIIAHSMEAEYLENGSSPLPQGTNIFTKFLIKSGRNSAQKHYNYDSVAVNVKVRANYDLNKYGFSSYVLHTPGHSRGSMSLIIDNDLAIVGDAMFGVFKWSVYPPFADDTEMMIESWDKLLKTGCSRFLPGHGSEISRKLLEKKLKRN